VTEPTPPAPAELAALKAAQNLLAQGDGLADYAASVLERCAGVPGERAHRLIGQNRLGEARADIAERLGAAP
jgi:cytochrome c1